MIFADLLTTYMVVIPIGQGLCLMTIPAAAGEPVLCNYTPQHALHRRLVKRSATQVEMTTEFIATISPKFPFDCAGSEVESSCESNSAYALHIISFFGLLSLPFTT